MRLPPDWVSVASISRRLKSLTAPWKPTGLGPGDGDGVGEGEAGDVAAMVRICGKARAMERRT